MLNSTAKLSSRLLIGGALYPRPRSCRTRSSFRRHYRHGVAAARGCGGKTGDAFWSLIRSLM